MIVTPARKLLSVIFLSSFSCLAYETALVRLFSISLSHHFAFMIISIAMLGVGASGTMLSLYPKLRNPLKIPFYALLLGAAITASYLLANHIPFDPAKLSWDRGQLLYIGLYYITLTAPFFCAGLIIATAFTAASDRAGQLYGADLLGAGAGSMGIILLMGITEPQRAVFILSSLALTASLLSGGCRLKVAATVLILCNLFLLLANPPFTQLRMSPYKGLQLSLRYPGAVHLKTFSNAFSRLDSFISPAARFAPGLSLKYLDVLPEQIGISTDGSDINAVTSPQDDKTLKFLAYLPAALPYEIGRKDDVLILDPKGGLHILLARKGGAKNIYKFESNTLFIRVVGDEYRDFAGDLYGDKTWAGLGRSRLKALGRNFDIIDLSLTGAMPSSSFGIAEDYRLTVEAFREYIGHLKPDGRLSISLFILPPPRTELRLLNTIIAALKETGIERVEDHIAAIRSWGSISFLIKRSPFTDDEIIAVRKFAEDRRFDPIHYRGIREEETNVHVRMPSNEYFVAFKKLLNDETRSAFTEEYLFDIESVRDDSPFFHYYLKIENAKTIYRVMGEKWQFFMEEGYILPAILMQALILSLLLIILPAASGAEGGEKGSRAMLFYFACLGIAFMFLEVSLIQKFILPLENPSYAVAVVLTSLLISSGLGSLLSRRTPFLGNPRITVAVSTLVIIYSFLIPPLSAMISPYPMPLKIVLVFLILFPLGLLTGMPFPAGLKMLGLINNSLIPWAWAINGCLSVLAPVLASVLAITTGFRMVLWIGALAYFLAFATVTAFGPLPPSAQKPPA